MNIVNQRDICEHWALETPLTITPMMTGVNNLSFHVRSKNSSYILKYYTAPDSDRLRFEHALLGRLMEAHLPFAIPAPIPAKSTKTIVPLGHHATDYMSLFHLIPGDGANVDSLADVRRCGEALAMLDNALVSIRIPAAIPTPSTFGDLAAVHAYIPDPVQAIKQVRTQVARVDALTHGMTTISRQWREQTTEWTKQIIHADPYPANMLVDAGVVTGVLDFEYAGLGYRAMDFAIGLTAFGIRHLENDPNWPVLQSFASGYLQQSPLSTQEVGAIPTLILLREYTSLVHWLGRMTQGLTTMTDIRNRAERALRLNTWMLDHQNHLQHLLRSASPG